MKKIRIANLEDVEFLSRDIHIRTNNLKESIERKYIYIIEDMDRPIGWLRYNLFWDNTPFLNMLYILEEYRNKGYGSYALRYWENDMKQHGYKELMTSTLVHENAIHFYLKYNYTVVGGFHPSKEEYEIILKKELL